MRAALDRLARHFEPGGRLSAFAPVFEMVDTILYTPAEVTRTGSHVRDAMDLKRMMTIVVVALLPCAAFGIYNVGYQAHWAIAAGAEPLDTWQTDAMRSIGLPFDAANVFACVVHGALYYLPVLVVTFAVGGGVEVASAMLRKHPVNEGFLVTGMLVPLILPATIPLWQLALGVAFGVVFGKEVFGGTGMNFLNPALVIRAFLFFAYPGQMSGDAVWTPVSYENVDATSAASWQEEGAEPALAATAAAEKVPGEADATGAASEPWVDAAAGATVEGKGGQADVDATAAATGHADAGKGGETDVDTTATATGHADAGKGDETGVDTTAAATGYADAGKGEAKGETDTTATATTRAAGVDTAATATVYPDAGAAEGTAAAPPDVTATATATAYADAGAAAVAVGATADPPAGGAAPAGDPEVDVVTCATWLTRAGREPGVLSHLSLWDAFLGRVPGSLGETSTLACLLGALLLLLTRIASWRTMAGVALGTFVAATASSVFAEPGSLASMPFHWHFVLGGWAFGAVFMATDPVTSPLTDRGRLLYGALIGVVVVLVRVFNPAYPEGMMLAILFMNMFAPLIDHYVMRANIRRREARHA